MISSLGVLRLYPGDFGFERGDPLNQFGLRIAVERFLAQKAGRVTAGAGKVVVHSSGSIALCLLAVNGPQL